MDWWKEESMWESRSIPLAGFLLSPRMIAIFLFFTVLGLVFGIPFSNILQKGAVLGLFMIAGFVMAFKKVNMVPFELQLLYIILYRGPEKKKIETERAQVLQEESEQEMYVDSAVPLTFSGKVKTNEPERVVLYVDGAERASASVSPEKPEYRIYYYPGAGDVGAHTLTLMVGKEKIQEIKVVVKPKGGAYLDAKK